jgi:hypothetical protein
MKTRTGFVSNSSSCSFQIYGVYYNHAEEILLPEMVEVIKNQLLVDCDPEDYEEDDLADRFDELFEEYISRSKLDLSIETGQDSENKYIGSHFPEEDETPRQWKVRLSTELAKILKPKFAKGDALSWHEEAWYNG